MTKGPLVTQAQLTKKAPTAAKSRSERAKPVALTTVLTEAVKHEAAIAASQNR